MGSACGLPQYQSPRRTLERHIEQAAQPPRRGALDRNPRRLTSLTSTTESRPPWKRDRAPGPIPTRSASATDASFGVEGALVYFRLCAGFRTPAMTRLATRSAAGRRAQPAACCSLGRAASERAERPLDPRPDLGHHQLHRAHRSLMRGRADFERKAHVDRVGRTDLGDELFGDGLDVADQEIFVDLFE